MFSPLFSHQQKAAIQSGRGWRGELPLAEPSQSSFVLGCLLKPPSSFSLSPLPPSQFPLSLPPSLQRFQAWTGGWLGTLLSLHPSGRDKQLFKWQSEKGSDLHAFIGQSALPAIMRRTVAGNYLFIQLIPLNPLFSGRYCAGSLHSHLQGETIYAGVCECLLSVDSFECLLACDKETLDEAPPRPANLILVASHLQPPTCLHKDCFGIWRERYLWLRRWISRLDSQAKWTSSVGEAGEVGSDVRHRLGFKHGSRAVDCQE